MSAAFEGGGFGCPESELAQDLSGALLAGLEILRPAAAERGLPEETVTAVFEAAWSPLCEFTASQVHGYHDVVELSVAANGWEWTEACIVDSEWRRERFLAVCNRAAGYAAKHFSALHEHDRSEVVEDLLYLELSGSWIHSTAAGAVLPGWQIPGIVFERLQWRLLDAKKKLVDREREITVRQGDREMTYGIQSLDKFVEDLGERPVLVRPMWDVSVDDASIEAVAWAAARVNLADRGAAMIGGARAGSARDKITLTVNAAMWVLTRGSEDELNEDGGPASGSAEELRVKFSQEPRLVCFLGMRSVAPERWGKFPDTHVPLLGDLKAAASEAKTANRPHADWFTKVSARKNDLHKKAEETGIPGVLHCVTSLVESLIKAAARDTDI